MNLHHPIPVTGTQTNTKFTGLAHICHGFPFEIRAKQPFSYNYIPSHSVTHSLNVPEIERPVFKWFQNLIIYLFFRDCLFPRLTTFMSCPELGRKFSFQSLTPSTASPPRPPTHSSTSSPGPSTKFCRSPKIRTDGQIIRKYSISLIKELVSNRPKFY